MRESILKFLVPEILYLIVCGVFLRNLGILNKKLLSLNLDSDSLKLVQYNECEPLKYFGGALVLIILLGASIGYMLYCCFKGYFGLIEIVLSMILVPCNIGLIGVILKAINNPILQAILGVGGVFSLFIGSFVSSQKN